MVRPTSTLLLSIILATATHAQNLTYKPLLDASGAGFFQHFDFFTGPDPTHGLVKYIPFAEANASSLIGTISGGPADGAVYLGVDFSSTSPEGRRSVRLESKRSFGPHLIVADVFHMPAICGTWQAMWALGPEWPANGEIDFVESVGDSSVNRMSLHTKEGLRVGNHSQAMTGTLERDDCAVNAENVGCTVLDNAQAASSGSAFNAKSGGVFASEFSAKGVQVWFFPRDGIPADIVAGVPMPAAWGKPNGMFMGENVDWERLFRELKIVINTTFCGDWAGKVWGSSECAQLAPSCEEYVAGNPGVFKDAYWAIKSLRVYQEMLVGN